MRRTFFTHAESTLFKILKTQQLRARKISEKRPIAPENIQAEIQAFSTLEKTVAHINVKASFYSFSEKKCKIISSAYTDLAYFRYTNSSFSHRPESNRIKETLFLLKRALFFDPNNHQALSFEQEILCTRNQNTLSRSLYQS